MAELRLAFVAGSNFQIDYDENEGDESTMIQPDFGDWVKRNFDITID